MVLEPVLFWSRMGSIRWNGIKDLRTLWLKPCVVVGRLETHVTHSFVVNDLGCVVRSTLYVLSLLLTTCLWT